MSSTNKERIDQLETIAEDTTAMLFNIGNKLDRIEDVINARIDGIENMQNQLTNVARMVAKDETNQLLKQQRLDCDAKIQKAAKSKFGWAQAIPLTVALIALLGVVLSNV